MSSGVYYIDALLAPSQFRWNSNAPGTPLTVTYGFMSTMPAYSFSFGFEAEPFRPFTVAQQQGVDRAVQMFEQVCNVDFVYRWDGDSAQIRFGSADLGEFEAAHTYYPDPFADYAGDVWFNVYDDSVYNQNAGSYGFMATLHEMGHALGLKHSFEDGQVLPSDKDNRQYTVMSYDEPTSMSDVEPSSLMLYDIATLQYLYGANTSYQAGNTNWRWNANETFRYCIWDGGGTDTLDASNQTRRVIINLNPGTFSSLGSYQAGDAIDNLSIAYNCWIENAIGGSGNDTITGNQLANRLDGGSGNDSIYGGAGNDTLIGGAGGDLLDGGADVDTVTYVGSTAAVSVNLATGGTGGDAAGDTYISIETVIGTQYNDTIIGNGQDNRLIGGAGADILNGGGGFDIASYETTNGEYYFYGVYVNLATGVTGRDAAGDQLISIEGVYGSYGDDTLIGDSGANRLMGAFGKDTLDGGLGADVLDGGDGDLDMADYSGSDAAINVNMATGVLTGGYAAGDTLIGIEYVNGSRFNDVIVGDAGWNWLIGNDGDDTLDGGAGEDTLSGGAGNDLFFVDNENDVVFGGEGYDEIRATANRAGTGHTGEKLVFIGTGDFVGWGGIMDNLLIGGAGNDTLHGDSGVDTLIGNDGNDILFGDWGNDTLDGGAGLDWAGYNGTVTIDLQTGERTGDAVGDIYISIEGILASGDIRGDDNANWFKGFAGNDRFDGRGGNDTVIYRGSANEYDVTTVGGNKVVTAKRSSLAAQEGVDTLISIENIVFEGSIINHAPTIWLPLVQVTRTASSVFGFLRGVDADGDNIVRYEFRDRTAGFGYFTINGVVQAANQTFTVEGSDLPNLYFVGGIGADSFDVRAFDGVGWGDWTTKSFVAVNQAPTVIGHSQTATHANSRFAASALFSVSDPEGDTITRYSFSFEIAYNAGGNGYYTLNGVQQGTYFEVDASDLAKVEFVASTIPGQHNALTIRAFDGSDWSNSGRLDVSEVANAAPLVSRSSLAAQRGGALVTAASLINVSDPDDDAITRYRFYDGTTGNGRFVLSGTPQVEGANIEITAGQLSSLQYGFGGGGTSDIIWAQAYDGYAWSTWASFTVAAVTNVAPIASVQNLAPGKGTTFIAGASLFTVTDPDDANMAKYRFFDGTAGNGCFQLNGDDQVELKNIEINASDLANFRFRTSTSGSDVLWVQAFDGTAWSAWKTFTVAAPANVAPTVNVQNLSPAHADAFISGVNLFTVSDPDDASMARFRFFDGTAGNGCFQLNGGDQVELKNIEINASDLVNFRYRTSATGAGDTLWVQAFDGTAWSAWKSFNVNAPANVAPVVSVQALNPTHGTAFIAGSALFTVSDPDDANMAKYRFFDGSAGNGRFQLNGQDRVELTNIEISASDLANFRYRTSATGTGDTLWVQAFDGTAWSAWKSFNVAAPPNNAPVVTVNQASLSPTRGTATIAASNFFSVSDADNDTITQFRFFDGNAGNGRFELNGDPQVEVANITINASDLANFRYRTSTTGTGDTLWVQASDGTSWSAWKSFNVAAPQNNAPVVSVADRLGVVGFQAPASALFTASDADNDPIVAYQFWDSTPGQGHFEISGAAKGENQAIDVMANQLAATQFVVSNNEGSVELLWARASDGTSWGAWKSFTITAVSSLGGGSGSNNISFFGS